MEHANAKGRRVPFLLGTCFVLTGLLVGWILVELWPRTMLVDQGRNPAEIVDPAAARQGRAVCPVDAWKVSCGEEKTCTVWLEQTCILKRCLCLTPDARILLLVLLAGALGSYVHATQSFVSYVGNRKFGTSWTWWYVLRVPVGAALAVLFYFVVRGGLLSATTLRSETEDINLYGIISFAALAGLFSKQAVDKLGEVFDTLFRTAEDAKRADKLTDRPKPAIKSIVPPAVVAADGAVQLTISGSGFVKATAVHAAPTGAAAQAQRLPSTYEGAERLTASFDPTVFPGQPKVQVWVVNPEPGGGPSSPVDLTVT